MVRLLIERGAESNATGFAAKTALHWAADLGYEDIVGFLVSKGADAHPRDSNGNTPLSWASRSGHVGVVRMLLAHMGVEGLQERENGGDMALHCAAHFGHEEVVKLLLFTGAQAEERRERHTTPLMRACKKGHLRVVKMLVQHMQGQGLEERNKDEHSALYRAAAWGHEQVVSYLLAEGAQASSRDNASRTILMMACGRGHMGVVKILHQHTGPQGLIDVTAYGWTALHCAAKERHEEVLRFLLLNGADPTSRDRDGKTPRDIAGGQVWDEEEGQEKEEDEEPLAERLRGVAVFEVSLGGCG
jgi:ankyrin repeat protein